MPDLENAPEDKVFTLANFISALPNMNPTELMEKLEGLIFYLSSNTATLNSVLGEEFDLNAELKKFFYEQIEHGKANLEIPLKLDNGLINLKISARPGCNYHITLESISQSSKIQQEWNEVPEVKERHRRIESYLRGYRDLQNNPHLKYGNYWIEVEYKELQLNKDEEGEILLEWQTFKDKGPLNEGFTNWITSQLDFMFSYSNKGVPVWDGFVMPKITRIYNGINENGPSWSD